MKCITLKEFCNEFGFYPNRKRSLSDFANLVGLSVSYISKLYNARMVGSSGPQWERLCKYVEQYGYQLITANPTDYMQSNLLKENKKLNKRITYLENYIKLLEFQLNEIQELIRISKRIANYENDKKILNTKEISKCLTIVILAVELLVRKKELIDLFLQQKQITV